MSNGDETKGQSTTALPCIFCKVDALGVPASDKMGAYYALGVTGEHCPPPCSQHQFVMVRGAAALGEACGDPKNADIIRSIARETQS